MLAAQLPTLTAKDALAADVVALAARGLEQMYDPQHGLFCFKLRQSPKGMVREGVSRRYTMMTLLGLHRLDHTGARSPVDIETTFERLIAETGWIGGIGDLGLLLWLCAVVAPDRLPHLAEEVGARGALIRYRDARQCSTMELAWFLSGLAHSLSTGQKGVSHLADDARTTFHRLKANQGAKGIFGHLARNKSVAGLLRGRIGSFADQAYPIYAMAKFSQCSGNREAVERASECARTLCQLQGPCGEWYWHYDSGTGRMVETYPVYSVHQDGMAPMALSALAEVSGCDFTAPIRRGLGWIEGNNELRRDLRDPSAKLIWRNLQLSKPEQYLRRMFTSRRSGPTSAKKLTVNKECRPYELGWALYALAGREHLCTR